MPESRVRKGAAAKKRVREHAELVEQRAEKHRIAPPGGGRRWVPVTFVTVGLLGVLWLVVYYVAGQHIPGMRGLADWNILIGMAMMASSFLIATMWK